MDIYDHLVVLHILTTSVSMLLYHSWDKYEKAFGIVGSPNWGLYHEMTYDNFHEGADRIYLAGSSFRLYGDGFTYNSSSFLADYLAKNCPEIEKVCRIFYDWNEKKIKNEDVEFVVRRIEVDSNFISMFNIKVLDGDNYLQLKKDEIAITER